MTSHKHLKCVDDSLKTGVVSFRLLRWSEKLGQIVQKSAEGNIQAIIEDVTKIFAEKHKSVTF